MSKRSIITLAALHMTPPCWNHTWSMSFSSLRKQLISEHSTVTIGIYSNCSPYHVSDEKKNLSMSILKLFHAYVWISWAPYSTVLGINAVAERKWAPSERSSPRWAKRKCIGRSLTFGINGLYATNCEPKGTKYLISVNGVLSTYPAAWLVAQTA